MTYYIYKYTNKFNNMVYIGCTCRLKQRMWEHMRCSEREDCYFHDAIKEFGYENFEFEVIDQTDSKEKAYDLEKRYIKEYDSYHNGYNSTKGGTGATLWNVRKIVLLDSNGNIEKTYESAAQAQKEDGYCNSDVLLSCKTNKLCKGRQFMFLDDYEKNGPKKYVRKKAYNLTPIIQCDSNGNFIRRFESVKQASEETNTNRTSVSNSVIGKNKLSNGYIFVYERDFPIKDIGKYKRRKKGKKIASVDIETNQIVKTYDRIADAGRDLGVSYKPIHKVVDMPGRMAYGYKWISQ